MRTPPVGAFVVGMSKPVQETPGLSGSPSSGSPYWAPLRYCVVGVTVQSGSRVARRFPHRDDWHIVSVAVLRGGDVGDPKLGAVHVLARLNLARHGYVRVTVVRVSGHKRGVDALVPGRVQVAVRVEDVFAFGKAHDGDAIAVVVRLGCPSGNPHAAGVLQAHGLVRGDGGSGRRRRLGPLAPCLWCRDWSGASNRLAARSACR